MDFECLQERFKRMDSISGFFFVAEGQDFFEGLFENKDGLVNLVVVGGLCCLVHGESGALRGDCGNNVLVEAYIGGKFLW